MKDIGVSIGLVLVIEGLVWAVFPGLARRLLESAAVTPEQQVRALGVLALASGVAVVWLFRG